MAKRPILKTFESAMTFALFMLILLSVSLNAFAQVALRKAMLVAMPLPAFDRPLSLTLHLAENPYLWAGMILFAGSIGLWLGVLSKIPVSVAYPMASMGYVIAAVSGAVFLNEGVTLMRTGGLSLICIGVYIVAQSA